ncbi:MAG: metallophosphoesterase family protein [Thermoplasmatota archaeon]
MELEEFCREMVSDENALDSLSEEDAEKVLSSLKKIKIALQSLFEFPVVELNASKEEKYILYIIGDIHGDLETARTIVRYLRKLKKEVKERNKSDWKTRFLFLGDYVDRAPKDIENGGFKTILYLLCAKVLYPQDIIMLRGNHEAINMLMFSPYELPVEISELFGSEYSEDIHDALMGIFSSLPLILTTSNGMMAVHAGVIKDPDVDIKDIDQDDEELILPLLWGDPYETETFRGEISKTANFSKKDVTGFLQRNGCRVLVRGHDYRTMGFDMYNNKMLTLHTSRKYENKGSGGVLLLRNLVHYRNPITESTQLKLLELKGEKIKLKERSSWKK